MADSQLSTARLEAFSDGVIAVIITIMVLELHVPSREISNADGLRHLAPVLCVYLLSFVQVGIYWVNHHYMMDDVPHVTHGLLWANLGFLFTLSLFPFAANWIGERGITPFAVALYAVSSVLPAVAWRLVDVAIRGVTGKSTPNSVAKQALSTALYLGAIPMAYVQVYVSLAMIVAVAVLWLIAKRCRPENPRPTTEFP